MFSARNKIAGGKRGKGEVTRGGAERIPPGRPGRGVTGMHIEGKKKSRAKVV